MFKVVVNTVQLPEEVADVATGFATIGEAVRFAQDQNRAFAPVGLNFFVQKED
jgi:hypothetical protein